MREPTGLRCLVLALSLLVCPGRGEAQTPAGAQQASEPHEALSIFEGTWTTSDATPADEFRESCAWLAEGRRHMVCQSRWKAANGYREGLSIFSFDASTNEYIYTGFRAGGAVVTMRGARTPGRWVFVAERGAGKEKLRTRVTIVPNPDGSFRFTSESAAGDEDWRRDASFVYLRVDAAPNH